MADDIKGLHDRFDNLEKNFDEVRIEQHEMSKSILGVSHRIDIMEVQVEAAQKRETMVVNAVNEKLDNSTSLIKKLFDKFDEHDKMEKTERVVRNDKEIKDRDNVISENRKLKLWVISTCVTAIMSIGLLWINKVIAG